MAGMQTNSGLRNASELPKAPVLQTERGRFGATGPAHGAAAGAPHLARRGAMIAQARALIGNTSILIADDSTADVKYMTTTMRLIVGDAVDILSAASIRKAVETLQSKPVGLIFIDDRISGVETFEHAMPQLRSAGFDGPVIVISGFLSPERRRLVFALGAVDAIHKDELEGLRLAEAVVRALAPGSGGDQA